MNFDFSSINIGDGINAIQKATGIELGNVSDLLKNLNNDQLKMVYEKLSELLKTKEKLPEDFKNNLEHTVTELKTSDISTWKDKLGPFLSNGANIATLTSLGMQIVQLFGISK